MSAPIPNRDAPTFTVKIGPITSVDKGVYLFTTEPVDVSERVISLEFDEDDQKADKFDLTMDNFDLSLLDDPNWKHGNGIVIAYGYAGNLAPARTCLIQKITGSLALKVEALSTGIAMNKLKTSATFESMKRSDIVASIALKNGFGPSAQFIDDSEVVIPATHQARMTDAEFLQSLARREGFVFYIGPDGLHWERRKMNTKPMRQFIYYLDPGQGDILTWNIDNDVTTLPGVVTAMGRDALKKTDINEVGSNSDTERDTTAPIAIAVAQRTGETVTVDPATPTATSAVILTNAPNSEAAKREADGKFIKAQQVAAHLTIDAIGDPSVSAKMIIDVQGISKRLSGNYYVKKCKHSLTATSYTMKMGVVSDGLNGGPGTAGVKSDGNLNKKEAADGEQLNVYQVSDRTGEVTYKPNTGSGT